MLVFDRKRITDPRLIRGRMGFVQGATCRDIRVGSIDLHPGAEPRVLGDGESLELASGQAVMVMAREMDDGFDFNAWHRYDASSILGPRRIRLQGPLVWAPANSLRSRWNGGAMLIMTLFGLQNILIFAALVALMMAGLDLRDPNLAADFARHLAFDALACRFLVWWLPGRFFLGEDDAVPFPDVASIPRA